MWEMELHDLFFNKMYFAMFEHRPFNFAMFEPITLQCL